MCVCIHVCMYVYKFTDIFLRKHSCMCVYMSDFDNVVLLVVRVRFSVLV